MASFCPMASHNPIFTEFAHVAQCGMAWLKTTGPGHGVATNNNGISFSR
jgi:hypothetical protein